MIQSLQFFSASLIFAAVCSSTSPATDQTPPNSLSLALHLVLEQRTGATVKMMPQNHVFDEGDMVRLRIRSEEDAHLYVLDRSSSGKLTVLFPNSGATDDRISRNHEYTLPNAKDGWFRIIGPAGYETLFFLVSSDTAQHKSLLLLPSKGPDDTSSVSESIVPRCDDDLWRSRGDCLDVNGGVRQLEGDESVPDPLRAVSNVASRDISVNTFEGDTAVSAAAVGRPAVVYEFRIAHH